MSLGFKRLNSITTLVVKYTSANAEATRKVYCGLSSRMECFTRSWDQYRGRPRFFSVHYHRATLDNSGWVERLGSGLGPPQNEGSASWTMALTVEPSRKGCESVILQEESNTANYFSMEGNLAYCNDVCEWMWRTSASIYSWRVRLFISLPKVSLKAVLLHNDNKYPSILLVQAVHTKETQANILGLLKKKTMLWRSPAEHMSWTESCGKADRASGRSQEILYHPLRMGQPIEGQELPCKAMDTPRRKDSRSEECSFSRQEENIFICIFIYIFTSTSKETWVN